MDKALDDLRRRCVVNGGAGGISGGPTLILNDFDCELLVQGTAVDSPVLEGSSSDVGGVDGSN